MRSVMDGDTLAIGKGCIWRRKGMLGPSERDTDAFGKGYGSVDPNIRKTF